jgi:DNA-binding NarL/FixJ family response regulator
VIKVLIVDDNIILRSGLKTIIQQEQDIKVVGCARNGKEALELCDKLLPDLVLMDIKMPVYDGVEGTKLIKEKHKEIKIIMLTTFDDEEYITKALINGADGYILKDIGDQELINVIKNTAKGFVVVQQSVLRDIRNKYETAIKMKNVRNITIDINLTNREKSIIKLIVDGKKNKEIAKELYLAEGSVRNIISSVLEKLKLQDRTQLAVFAIKNNLV